MTAQAAAAELTPAVASFRSPADPTVAPGPAQSTVSAHLVCLRDCRLVESRQSFCFLTRPTRWDLLAATEGVLGATDATVALCPNYGRDG